MKNNKSTNIISGFVFCLLILTFFAARQGICTLYAEESKPSSTELIDKAWAAHGKRDVEATLKYTNALINLYKDEASKQQASLVELPKVKEEIEQLGALNDVATAYFIQAEIHMRQQEAEEAKKVFQLIIDKYPYAQAWDQRGWFWQISEASKQSIKKLETGNIEIEQQKKASQIPTTIILYAPGTEDVVDYEKYGVFENVGAKGYKYVIDDQEGLSEAVGEGIYPNTTSVRWDPEFKKAIKDKRLEGDLWDFVHSPDLEAAFFKWTTSSEPQGVRLFYTGLILERAGLIKHALKCYRAITVHYPASYGWTYWHTPWYVGQAAIAKIKSILVDNPQLGYKLEGADIKIINGFDNDVANDIPIVNPGKFVKTSVFEKLKPNVNPDLLNIIKRSGKGKVYTVQYETGDWQLMVDQKPYTIKGITYTPVKIG